MLFYNTSIATGKYLMSHQKSPFYYICTQQQTLLETLFLIINEQLLVPLNNPRRYVRKTYEMCTTFNITAIKVRKNMIKCK